jgi:hypothetical protein
MPSHERPYRDLTNVVAKYPFESSLRFPGSSGDRLAAWLSAFCRSAPTVGFMASQFFFTANLLWERAVSSRPSLRIRTARRSAALGLGKQAHHLLAQE